MRVFDRIGRGRSQLVVADFADVLIDKCLDTVYQSGLAGDLDRQRVAWPGAFLSAFAAFADDAQDNRQGPA
jgi:hypothetical protein